MKKILIAIKGCVFMTYQEIQRNIIELQYRIGLMQQRLAVGEHIMVYRLGAGKIISYDERKMTIRFTDKEVVFTAPPDKDGFIDIHRLSELNVKLDEYITVLSEYVNPHNLIKSLLTHWRLDKKDVSADRTKEIVDDRIPKLIKDIGFGNGIERPMLRQLKKCLEYDEWIRLGEFVKKAMLGEKIRFKSEVSFEQEEYLKMTIKAHFRASELDRIKSIIDGIVIEKYKNKIISQLNEIFEKDYLSASEYFGSLGEGNPLSKEEFDEMRTKFISDWFSNEDNHQGDLPDREQLLAIGSTEKNTEIIARAGSGKTSTIVNRVKFLVNHCGVHPSEILMLAFNRKAVENMETRIKTVISRDFAQKGSMPHIMTFHALAHSIVHPTEALLHDAPEKNTYELSSYLQNIIDEKIRNHQTSQVIRSIMLAYFKGDWEAIEEGRYSLSKQDYVRYRRSVQQVTLKGEYVKSYGEKIIADILYEHNIEYFYEDSRKLPNGTIYRPDFTIKGNLGRRIVIEYLGLVGDREYDAVTRKKEAYWREKNNVRFIKIYPELIKEGRDAVCSRLAQIAAEEGLKFELLDEEEIWEKIKGRAIDHYTKTTVSFVNRCRQNALSPKELEELICDYLTDNSYEKDFLRLASEIYEDYFTKIELEKKEDFNGLMQRAEKEIKNGVYIFDKSDKKGDLQKLKHILVDEYQDFSKLFDLILNGIRTVSPEASLFCVGDDWQAINGYAGADLSYFDSFTERYEDASRYYISTNYRSDRVIVDTGAALTGDYSIKPFSEREGVIKIGYIDDIKRKSRNAQETNDECLMALLNIIKPRVERGLSVVLLARMNDRLPFPVNSNGHKANETKLEILLNNIRAELSPKHRGLVSAYTTHKYKGREADVVIILDACTSFYPLIHPGWIFQQVFGDTIEKIISDEKRLFYVALTRAKNELIIFTLRGEESPFLYEIRHKLGAFEWDMEADKKRHESTVYIEVSNSGRSSSPTFNIKEELRDTGYAWNTSERKWEKECRSDEFSSKHILEEPWIKKADGVVLSIYDPKQTKKYLICNGHLKMQ